MINNIATAETREHITFIIALYFRLSPSSKTLLGVGGHVAEADRGEAGAGEVEGRDVGLHVADTAGVRVVVLASQHRHPASD